MDKKEAEFKKRLLATFQIEAEEHITAMSKGLLELENPCSLPEQIEIVENIYREAHSLKGASRAVNINEIESVCSCFESIFAAWKEKKIESSRKLFDTLHHATDYISNILSGSEKDLPQFREHGLKIHEQLQEILVFGEEPEIQLQKPVETIIDEPSEIDYSKQVSSDTVRISKAKLDSLLMQTEEMLSINLKLKEHNDNLRDIRSDLIATKYTKYAGINKENLELFRKLDQKMSVLIQSSEKHQRMVSVMVNNLLMDTRKTLMLPFSTLLELLPKLTRDLSRDQGKLVEIELQGSENEIDKRILEEMKVPLIHLVRNCIDHGIERPEERKRLNKPETGKIVISVRQLPGKKVEILISDDGAGIDLNRVKEAALKHGIISGTEKNTLKTEDVKALIYRSGVSTSPIITDISGRGLGLAIVREKIERLGGTVSIETKLLQGTRLYITLPMTLATIKGVFVLTSGQVFVVPSANVKRIVRITKNEIKTVENKQVISFNNRTISFCLLSDILEIHKSKEKEGERGFIHVFILESGENLIAFGVDEILYEQEVLVKAIGKLLTRVRNNDGATVLGSGKVVPILNVMDLVRSAVKVVSTADLASETEEMADKKSKSVVVAEDSITARMLLKDILESAGYLVKTAVDGADALSVLREGDFDILVSDIDMPRMNGFDLTSNIRTDKKLAELPVVLVTALKSREDRERGMEVGANAYIEKGSFDPQKLLGIVNRLI